MRHIRTAFSGQKGSGWPTRPGHMKSVTGTSYCSEPGNAKSNVSSQPSSNVIANRGRIHFVAQDGGCPVKDTSSQYLFKNFNRSSNVAFRIIMPGGEFDFWKSAFSSTRCKVSTIIAPDRVIRRRAQRNSPVKCKK